MPSIYDAEANKLIEKAAEELKKINEIKAPAWAVYVKTGHFKKRPPVDKDWWYMRAAAILRYIYKVGPIGTQKLRTRYGGKKDRGHKKEHFYKGSGSVIRKILQQLEKSGLIKKAEKGIYKGRIITPKGISFLNKAAKQVSSVKIIKKAVEKKEDKKADEKKEAKKESSEKKAERAEKKEAKKAEKAEKKEAKEQKKEEKHKKQEVKKEAPKKEEAKEHKAEKKELKKEAPKKEAKEPEMNEPVKEENKEEEPKKEAE